MAVEAPQKHWMGAVGRSEHHGAFRADLKRLGMLDGDEKVTLAMVNRAKAHARKSGNETLMKRATLAGTYLHTNR
jgi:hypothetical protein